MEQYNFMITAIFGSVQRIVSIILAFLVPITGILFTVIVCIVADTIMGIWRSKKLKEKITSHKLSRVISKMFLYNGTIILFYIIDFYIFNEIMITFFSVPLLMTKVVALTLASIEIYSIDENWRDVKGKGLFDAFKSLVLRVKNIKDETDKLTK